MIKVTLEYNGTVKEFEDALGADENFDLFDSIVWQLDYGTKEDKVGYHNNIKITVGDEAYE